MSDGLIRIEVRITHPDLPETAAAVLDLDPFLADAVGLGRESLRTTQSVVDLVEQALKAKALAED